SLNLFHPRIDQFNLIENECSRTLDAITFAIRDENHLCFGNLSIWHQRHTLTTHSAIVTSNIEFETAFLAVRERQRVARCGVSSGNRFRKDIADIEHVVEPMLLD